MKPVIGLTPSHDEASKSQFAYQTYTKAIAAAGGIPVILPLYLEKSSMLQLVNTFNGFLFTGGPDPHPFLYGEETLKACGTVSPQRDSLELQLFSMVRSIGKPILGICRGIQIINTALGGTLYQDISSQLKETFPFSHMQPFHYGTPSHHVAVLKDSLLYQITENETLAVNSMHHQACQNIGKGLIASAWAPGHLIEAVEMPDYPYLLAVQWHPEHLWENDTASKKLFVSFINACCSKI